MAESKINNEILIKVYDSTEDGTGTQSINGAGNMTLDEDSFVIGIAMANNSLGGNVYYGSDASHATLVLVSKSLNSGPGIGMRVLKKGTYIKTTGAMLL